MQAVKDKNAFSIGGFPLLFLWLVLMGVAALFFWPLIIPIGIVAVLLASGFTIIQPNESRVVTFFGRYVGTLRESGFLYTVPFSSKTKVPLKLVNFVTDHLKVNDRNGNPIEIGAVVVWRVTDAAQATFNVDDYKVFVANQSDIAIRALAAHYPYDSETETSLRGNIDEIARQLQETLQLKLAVAGIHVEETRLTPSRLRLRNRQRDAQASAGRRHLPGAPLHGRERARHHRRGDGAFRQDLGRDDLR